MSYNTIKFDVRDAVAKITLNRPDKLNAFSDEMHEELRAIMPTLASDKVRAVLITGEGRAFGAGADLSGESASGGPALDAGETLEKNYNPLILFLRNLDKPVIAAVNGIAAGASMSLALACDIVLAAKSASFLQAFCNIGLIPDAGSTYFLPRLVGPGKAMGLTMLGEKLPAEEAERMGLIWKCYEDAELMPAAEALAARMAAGPTKGYALIKKAMNASLENDLAQQLDIERDYQRAAAETEDFGEGVAAFLQKRRADFKGR
ncbi:MAG: 2-(1,2-epoxy-1,2-dihydrophenyl)acetyl-CoA isomerase [Sneathiella sp.]|jgi:2-(1,2-epoxy-1,2-dihydrophenyl)acetyl-CoA isomerase|uniref:2-(1,2-epoxy-1,2-dihydrophenyl)acetyl-CoA isomerase PaaG n=1 Tax=Sneathiella sp. TaxID=1964365 RepID=UPI000C4A6EFC|nr:2-(1,2-epoxy-1,2-dihydrophenyl)acetyl-CoA isomerase PaaG [Sneathiella sp.]MAL79763.1 2-(1,2-epoxy-1,2-dihydrophenyl)acetyl-CoA isomerase [Sneathiella sp.]|tara:strand:+ start:333 stop:1118 length:786 start_codon:yes stop_codon:yes gene_type:complete